METSQTHGDSIDIKLNLQEHQSVFIVLQKEGTATDVLPSADGLQYAAEWLSLNEDWTLHLPDGWDAPTKVVLDSLMPWNEHKELGIRYFSGTATYEKTFRTKRIEKAARYVLELGEVKNTAQVWLNGKEVAHLWKKPFRCDITPYLKKGDNRLKIAVTNL